MKEKKVGDTIVFNYEVYDVVHNIEYEYDHTIILKGVVKEVIHTNITKYKVRVIGYVYVESENEYRQYDDIILEVRDDDVFRGSGLFNLLYPNLHKPTLEQIKYIQNCFNHRNGLSWTPEYILDTWYEKIMGDQYDEEEFK